MSQYIERALANDALINSVIVGKDLEKAVNAICSVPAADVVSRDCYDRLLVENDELRKVRPVVRCRDCDHWNEWDRAGHESLGNFRCSCAYWSVEDGVTFYTAPTDFCSYGEKRMDGDADA